jgi:peptidoglycan/xylan/chitin deacetylase (PgdA/CDA1 family)
MIEFLSKKMNFLQCKFSSHVLLYHSVSNAKALVADANLHNVTMEAFTSQAMWLKQNFDVRHADELFKLNDLRGQAAITFDDAYLSVFDEAIPILKELNLPCTVYVNGSSILGKSFWRDKIRYVIASGLLAEFIKVAELPDISDPSMDPKMFYRVSKRPNINSRLLDDKLELFLAKKSVDVKRLKLCVNDSSQLINSSLVRYGNHGLNHYVLTSLDRDDLVHEIGENHRLLTNMGFSVSKTFSIPFGRSVDVNEQVIEVLQSYGYESFFYSRDRINWKIKCEHLNWKIPSLERYMPGPSLEMFQKQIMKIGLKTVMSRIE